MIIEDEVVQLLVDEIQGTCTKNFEDSYHELVDNNPLYKEVNKDAVEQEFYTHVDNCSTCGWWCEAGELQDYGNGELTCDDCAPDEEI